MSVLLFLMLAANFRLYLKDGGHHVTNEYKVTEDRVAYYSVERSEWEQIPLDLVDLKRTETERKSGDEKRTRDAKVQAEEDQAERELQKEIRSVPSEPGVYLSEDGKLREFPVGEVKLVTDKKRSVLKAITPVPLISGKVTVEMDGESSANLAPGRRPEFYLRLATEEAFGIVRLEPKKGSRLVEKVSVIPVVKEMVEERNSMEIFRRQFADGLFKIWPSKDLEPGEYAVVTFIEGKVNIRVWDFRVN